MKKGEPAFVQITGHRTIKAQPCHGSGTLWPHSAKIMRDLSVSANQGWLKFPNNALGQFRHGNAQRNISGRFRLSRSHLPKLKYAAKPHPSPAPHKPPPPALPPPVSAPIYRHCWWPPWLKHHLPKQYSPHLPLRPALG
jgi:hypothetical protein